VETTAKTDNKDKTKCPETLWLAWAAMSRKGSIVLSVMSWVWVLLQGVFVALSAQHYLLYKEAAQRQCEHDAIRSRDQQPQDWARKEQ
jgi:hypothetical protein